MTLPAECLAILQLLLHLYGLMAVVSVIAYGVKSAIHD